MPLALVVVFVILVVLLRALVAPLLLIATVILSFARGARRRARSSSTCVFGFPGIDPSLPLFAFVFLVALGIDYNIFLMARVREETLQHGTREGMLRGLAVTGGVITSAGIVLAGTFAVLAVLPLVFLTEIGFVDRLRRPARHVHRALGPRAGAVVDVGAAGLVAVDDGWRARTRRVRTARARARAAALAQRTGR